MGADDLSSASIQRLRSLLDGGEVSALELVGEHIGRIEALDETYSAVIELNPDALDTARALDHERGASGARGALHGVPVVVKDNIDTGDRMQTTAGSLALEGTRALDDAPLVARLREAGAVIVAKTNLSEWANFRSTRSSSGWSSRGGQTRNAFDPARTPGGSSSGSAVAVALGMCAAAVGTETDGSIVSPSAMNGIVGIKPTVGLVSRRGIIPISSSQDTAGAMARSVSDAVLVLSVLAASDPLDASTAGADAQRKALLPTLDAGALAGARLGVARSYIGYHDRLDACFERALEIMRSAGAAVIEVPDLPPMQRVRPSEQIVMETEFRVGLERYLASRGTELPIRSVDDLVQFNRDNADRVMPHFGQEILEACQRRGTLEDAPYREARAHSLSLAAERGIDAALRQYDLDALVAPTTTPAWLIDWINGDNRRGSAACLPAVAGYPHVSVPMGFVEHLPVGLSFFTTAHHDRRIIDFAYAYEQRTLHAASRRPQPRHQPRP